MTIDLAPSRQHGLALRHPIMVASGGAGYGGELLDAVGEAVPSAIVTRSVTREPRRGNPTPRMAALEDGLLSSVGLPNPGLDAVLRRQGPRWASTDVPIIVSICGETVDDIGAMARTLEMQPDIAGVELNLACADRGRSGEPIGHDIEASELATVAARAATELPLMVKLTAAAPDLRAVARAVVAAGADVLSATAAVPGVAVRPDRQRASLGTAYGGVSGPALRPVGLRAVYEIAQVVQVPIVGIGGIAVLDDVLDYLAVGATAVGLATAALAEPGAPGGLAVELAAWAAANGAEDHADLVGTALPERRDRSSLRRGPFRP